MKNTRTGWIEMIRRVGSIGAPASRLTPIFYRWFETGSGGLLSFVVLLVFFSFAAPNFLTAGNIANVGDQVVVLGILVIGQTFVIITRNIDISVGSIVALCAMIMADLAKNYGLNPFVVISAGILVGVACGLINGLLVAKLKMNALVSTLATWSVIKGTAWVYTNGQPIYPLPDSFRWPAVVEVGGLFQANILYLLVLIVIGQLVLSKTKFGRHVYAVGGNPDVADLTGIRSDRIVISVYMISGAMAALGAVILAGKLSTGTPEFGDPYLLTAVAAAVLGGASLFGGEGSISKSLVGALVITMIGNGLNLLLIPIGWQKMVIGVVLALAILIDTLQHRQR